MVEIYFLYGLAFFVTGVAVWLETSRSSALPAAKALPFLAAFGLIHGGHEWIEMFQLMSPDPPTPLFQNGRLVILALSFMLLVEFGLRLLTLDGGQRTRQIGRWVITIIFIGGMILAWTIWGAGEEKWSAADVWCRYSLAVPGAVLATAGLYKRSRLLAREQTGISRDLLISGLAFLLYGVPGQVFVRPSPLPPSTVVNSALFLQALHFPVQLWRSLMASTVAIFTVRALRLFELQRQRQVEELSRARAEAQQQLSEEMAERQALQRKLLHQAVWAQEAERQHIARELHDEAGQALTALSWGLADMEKVLSDHPDEIQGRLRKLRRLADQVMVELRQLTTRLRPAVLDELGLVPALITYADDCSTRYSFEVKVVVTGQRRRLPSEIETALYRIAQEALTNVAKHAQATQADIRLCFDKEKVTLDVSDDGIGMDVETAGRAAARGKGWGLAGICERVELVGGRLDLRSTPGAGTDLSVRVSIPREEEIS